MANTISVFKNNLSVPLLSSIKASPVSGTINGCAGTASASPNIQQFTVSGSGLTANVTAAAPSGFEVSLSVASGYGGTITLNQTGGALDSMTVYVRSSAVAAAGNLTGNVVLSSAGTTTKNVAVSANVHALPTVNAVTNQTIVNGTATAAVNFTGSGNTFTWVNDTPGIGLTAGGTGNIPSFIAKNTGSTPIKATITVTPLNESGCAYINSNISNSVSVINLATNKIIATIPGVISPQATAVSPDGSKVYIVSYTNNSVFYTINTATNTIVSTLPISTRSNLICLSPDGKRAYVTHQLINTITVINTENNTVTAEVSLGPKNCAPQGLAITPDGTKVFISDSDALNNWLIEAFNTATLSIVDSIPVKPLTYEIAVNHKGDKLYAIGGDSVLIYNPITKTISRFVLSDPHATNLDGIAISPDDSRIYLYDDTRHAIAVFNTANIAASPTFINGIAQPGNFNLTPDGAFLYIPGNPSYPVEVFSTITNTKADSIAVTGNTVTEGNFITPGSRCTGTPITFTITVIPSSTASPTITTTGTLAALTTTAGTASSSTSFTVSGSNLTAGILVTPPAGFEVSTDNTTFGSTVTIAGTGTIAATTVYIRLAASTAAGTYSGNVVLTSTGATTVNLPAALSTVTGSGNTAAITAGTVSGTITACAGTASANPNIEQFSVSGNNLTTAITVTAPAGFEVSLTAGAGYTSSVTVAQSGGIAANAIVYIRSSAFASAGTITGNVVLSATGAVGVNVPVTAAINALPVVNAGASQTIPAGSATAAIAFTGTASTYSWVNDTPAIGLAANGIGNIPSFTALNTGTNPITATITVTPSGSLGCNGTAVTFTLTVNPASASQPVILTTGTLNALSSTYGQASAAGSFTVSGSNLTSGVVITAPPGYEISTDGTNYGSTITVSSTGTLATTTVYVRLAGTAASGTYAGNVVLTSGTTSVTVATLGSIIAPALLTVTADNKTRPFGANNPAFTLTYSGFANADTPSSITTLPTAVTTATPASIAGTYPITPGGAVAANYTLKYVSGTLTVTLTNVILTFNPLPDKTYGNPDFDPGASVVTGAAITYTSGNPSVATVVNGMIHIIGVGSAVITASVAADTSIKAVSQTLTVNKANQTITFTVIPALTAGAQYDLSGVIASTGLSVSFTVADTSIASVSGQTLNAHTAGTTTITASQAGNDNYNPVSVTLTFTVDDLTVNALLVHKELSPNGDGINDYLLIDGIQDYPSNTFTVYNRDGVRVAQVDGYDNSGHVFNGRSNFTGALQQAGTYFYVLQYTADASTKKKTGYFVLKYQ